MQELIAKDMIRNVLLVMLFCYLPHFFSSPLWLSLLIISVVGYRFLVNYYHFSLPNLAIRLFLMGGTLFCLFLQYRLRMPSSFYIGFLLTFIALKSLEVRTARDVRVLILCNLYIILASVLLYQELWIFFYILLTVGANLALMMKLTAPMVAVKPASKRLVKSLLLALPISLLLFYLFPRLSSPLWRVPSLMQDKTGFSEEMTLDNLSDLFNDDSIVMRIIFKANFKSELYWKGIILTNFNGLTWKHAPNPESPFVLLKSIDTSDVANYEILLEPHQKKWLFYQDNPIDANPNLLFSPEEGLVPQDNSPIYRRFDYTIVEKSSPYQALNKTSYQQNTALPQHGNPRLRAWAKEQFMAVNGNTEALIKVIANHIHHENYWYSLSGSKRGYNANLMDNFWFDSKRGYCESYTGALAIILRSVGIPARVILGYHGGQWNPAGQYLTVLQNNAHAWLEYWQEGQGWQRVDAVNFIAPEHIDPTIHQKQAADLEGGWLSNWGQMSSTLSWKLRSAFILETTQFFVERWLLFYNQDTQRELLQKLGLKEWDGVKLLQACIGVLLLLLAGGGLWYAIRQRWTGDALLREYHRLQQEMKRLGVNTEPPATFAKQLQELGRTQPQLQAMLDENAEQYELIRLRSADIPLESRNALLKLLSTLRVKLNKIK